MINSRLAHVQNSCKEGAKICEGNALLSWIIKNINFDILNLTFSLSFFEV